jgi:hypothetical protein
MPGPILRPSVATVAGWALVIAIALSTQYLFQPFVWANWSWDEVLGGWFEVAANRAVVALCIAFSVVAGSRLPIVTPRPRAATLAIAIVLGAVAGEAAMVAAGFPGEREDLNSVLGRVGHWSLLAGSVAAMYYLWLRTSRGRAIAQARELQRLQVERQIVQARLQAMRNQIEPHFLFNTLATVRRLHVAEPEQGQALLRNFIEYLRLTMANLDDPNHRLGQELALVRAYLGVVAVRMSGRLDARIEVPDEFMNCGFPPLTLATLVENAVQHGIDPAPDGGTIVVQARRVGEAVEVAVVDDGVGFGDTLGAGIGLANIRDRLRTLYGQQGRLVLEGNSPRGVRATIVVPCSAAAAT